MTTSTQDRLTSRTTLGGALVVLSALLLIGMLAGTGSPVLAVLAGVALAAGAAVLAVDRRGHGVVGGSAVGRTALAVFGLGPLAFMLLPASLPSVVTGMSVLAVVTAAAVVAAGSVIRVRVLHGVARWALVAVAADALLTAAMSTVQLEPLSAVYLGGNLELIRPLALLVWGLAVVHHGQAAAIRRRVSAVVDAWRRSTDVSGTAREGAEDRSGRV